MKCRVYEDRISKVYVNVVAGVVGNYTYIISLTVSRPLDSSITIEQVQSYLNYSLLRHYEALPDWELQTFVIGISV